MNLGDREADEVAIGGHGDRPVRRVRSEAGWVVVKRYSGDKGAEVFTAMQALWDSSFGRHRRPPGLPEPLGWLTPTSELVMEHLDGVPLADRSAINVGGRESREAAALLADLHRSAVVAPRRRSVAGIVRSVRRKLPELAPLVQTPYEQVVERLAERAQDVEANEAPVLVCSHGDFGPHNVVLTPSGLRLIDFDRIRQAPPARDVAYWGCWIWANLLVRGGEPSWELGDGFLADYIEALPRPADGLAAEVAFHRVAGLLRIVHGWSAMRGSSELALATLGEAARLLRRDR